MAKIVFVMEMNEMKIKCPNCGERLKVKLKTPNMDINIPCPTCKISSPLKSYIKLTEQQQAEEHTEYPKNEEETIIGTYVVNDIIGQLKVQNTLLSPFPLKMGRNVIGRKAKSSTADIQIPIQIEERSRTSREHLIIDVDKVKGKGIVHYLSLYPKKKINETLLNGEKLSSIDRIPLKSGDIVTLPDVILIFDIPDEEGTVF